MKAVPGVICSGNIVYDTLVHPVDQTQWGTTTPVDTIEWHIGGNGANTSVTLAALGVPVRLLGAVGRDDQGRFAIGVLRDSGVDTSAVCEVETPTAATVVLVNSTGARKFLHRMGASKEAFRAPIEFTMPLIDAITHYHLASIFMLPKLRPAAAATLERAHNAGLTTSLDTNWDPQGVWMGDLGACLPHLDTIFINEDEARMVTGSSDAAIAARILLDRGVGTAVMKLGARGCAIYTAATEVHCPAFDVEAKDTTGAGDCFVAGYLAASLYGIADSGRFANAVAAWSVQSVGAGAGVRSFEDVESWMHTAAVR